MSKDDSPIRQERINKALWDACDTFRGVVSASVYQDYVLTMLFLKYLSDVWRGHYEKYEQEYGDAPELITEMMKNERFVLPEGASFQALHARRNEPGNGERIDKALHAIEEKNGTKLRDGDHGVFQDISFNSTKLGDEATKNDALKSLLEDFAKDELDLSPNRVGTLDVIGNAYEYLIEKFAAGAGKKAGEFYTPAAVSELMARLVQPEEGDAICDPACGSASLLMKCARLIRENNNGSREYALFGQEAIGSTWALAKMNMFLHSEDNHIIKWGDTLRNPLLLDDNERLRQFDIVVANPPFSLDKWGHEAASNDPYKRYSRGVPPKTKGDYAFIQHMIETLKPETGRMAVVVPHGVLFRGASEGKIRKALVEENLLDCVIGLPEMLFFGTGIPAVIIIFRMDKTDTDVMFIDASREYRDGKKQNELTKENVGKIVDTYFAGKSAEKYARRATLEEISANGFNLNIPRYVDTFKEEEQIDLMAVRAERLGLKKELESLEVKMDRYLKELGYGS